MTSILEFTTVPKETLDIVEGSDEKPPLDNVEYPCQVCGKEAGPYSGRGRHPKFCPEHKKNRTLTGSIGTKVKGTNATLAAQATEALVQINNMVAVGLMVVSYPETAGAISEREETFRAQTYNALLTDPGLCRTILRAGTTSGKVSLLIAYSMLVASISPVAVLEFRQRKESNTEVE